MLWLVGRAGGPGRESAALGGPGVVCALSTTPTVTRPETISAAVYSEHEVVEGGVHEISFEVDAAAETAPSSATSPLKPRNHQPRPLESLI